MKPNKYLKSLEAWRTSAIVAWKPGKGIHLNKMITGSKRLAECDTAKNRHVHSKWLLIAAVVLLLKITLPGHFIRYTSTTAHQHKYLINQSLGPN